MLQILNQVIINIFTELIESQKCPGREKHVETRIMSIEEQWAALNSRSAEKSQKLTEANQEQQFNETIKGGKITIDIHDTDCQQKDLALVQLVSILFISLSQFRSLRELETARFEASQ